MSALNLIFLHYKSSVSESRPEGREKETDSRQLIDSLAVSSHPVSFSRPSGRLSLTLDL